METPPKDFGAVVVAGSIKYELLEHDQNQVKLRNLLEADQYIVIDLEALPGIASILTKAARELEVNQVRPPDNLRVD